MFTSRCLSWGSLIACLFIIDVASGQPPSPSEQVSCLSLNLEVQYSGHSTYWMFITQDNPESTYRGL